MVTIDTNMPLKPFIAQTHSNVNCVTP